MALHGYVITAQLKNSNKTALAKCLLISYSRQKFSQINIKNTSTQQKLTTYLESWCAIAGLLFCQQQLQKCPVDHTVGVKGKSHHHGSHGLFVSHTLF